MSDYFTSDSKSYTFYQANLEISEAREGVYFAEKNGLAIWRRAEMAGMGNGNGE